MCLESPNQGYLHVQEAGIGDNPLDIDMASQLSPIRCELQFFVFLSFLFGFSRSVMASNT